MADQIELAYAVTVHKSQGSEFPAVILPVMGYKSKMHYRNLLYTAVTRAKSQLIILGVEPSIQYMVENDRRTIRYTNLLEMLRGDCEI
jgi:exodeoxyribonuclease V alpha subunit